MEHSLHLAAKHFVQSIAPHFNTRGAASGANSDGNNAPDDDNNDVDDSDSDDGDESVNNGDSLGKAIAFVKQVSVPVYYCLINIIHSCRFVNRRRQGCFSEGLVTKSGSPHGNSCSGSVRVGARSTNSLSVSSISRL